MESRRNLQRKFESILGSRYVYFQPPESAKMKYPCIRYSLNGITTKKADNTVYNLSHCYTVILIHTDPDNTLKERLLTEFRYISMDRVYISDNLYHYIYTLYFDEEE